VTDATHTDPIEIDMDDDVEEVAETEVTEENYEKFLPNYSSSEAAPAINDIVGEDGKLLPAGQAAWDEDPPEPQDGFEDEEGI
jgi:hypothetical protein